MFAVIKTGGKQYKVAKNDVIKVEKLVAGGRNSPKAEKGAVVVFDQILAVGEGAKVTLGSPLVKNMKVSAEVINQGKDDKVIIFKKKRRQNYRRKNGHRQELMWLRIQDIGEGLTAKAAPAQVEKKKAAPKAEAASEAEAPKKPAAKKATAKKTEKK